VIDASRRTRGLQFTRDGKSVVYAMRENGVDNIWMQPLDGSAGHRGGAVVHAVAFWSCG
jgi:Tol biopolymer transport system component